MSSEEAPGWEDQLYDCSNEPTASNSDCESGTPPSTPKGALVWQTLESEIRQIMQLYMLACVTDPNKREEWRQMLLYCSSIRDLIYPKFKELRQCEVTNYQAFCAWFWTYSGFGLFTALLLLASQVGFDILFPHVFKATTTVHLIFKIPGANRLHGHSDDVPCRHGIAHWCKVENIPDERRYIHHFGNFAKAGTVILCMQTATGWQPVTREVLACFFQYLCNAPVETSALQQIWENDEARNKWVESTKNNKPNAGLVHKVDYPKQPLIKGSEMNPADQQEQYPGFGDGVLSSRVLACASQWLTRLFYEEKLDYPVQLGMVDTSKLGNPANPCEQSWNVGTPHGAPGIASKALGTDGKPAFRISIVRVDPRAYSPYFTLCFSEFADLASCAIGHSPGDPAMQAVKEYCGSVAAPHHSYADGPCHKQCLARQFSLLEGLPHHLARWLVDTWKSLDLYQDPCERLVLPSEPSKKRRRTNSRLHLVT